MNTYAVEMESRVCNGCGKTYRVLVTSPVTHCSTRCLESGFTCRPEVLIQKKMNVAGARENVTVSVSKKTPTTAYAAADVGMQRMRRRGRIPPSLPEQKTANDTSATRRSEMPAAVNGHDKTKSDNSKRSAVIMAPIAKKSSPASRSTSERTSTTSNESSKSTATETAIASEPKTPTTAIVETQPASLLEQSENLRRDASASLTLLTDTAKHLHSLMKGLHPNLPAASATEQFVSALDPDRVKAAAECGKQIISTVRMQLDMLKFAKELKDESK